MAHFGRRVRVIGPTLGVMALGAAWSNGDIALSYAATPAESALFTIGPFAGPFVGLFGHVVGFADDPLWYVCVTGLPLLVAIASHPACPRVWTGVLCVLGVLSWFLLSMSYLHQASG